MPGSGVYEHRCFVYESYQGVSCPVCLGNGGVPELLSPRLTLTSAFAWVAGLVSKIISRSKSSAPAPRILYEPKTADVDRNKLGWEKLGFVVLDIDGASGKAVYVDEDGAEVPIDAFGSGSGPAA